MIGLHLPVRNYTQANLTKNVTAQLDYKTAALLPFKTFYRLKLYSALIETHQGFLANKKVILANVVSLTKIRE